MAPETTDYEEFLDQKRITAQPVGFEPGTLHPLMFDYQRDVTAWALRRGRAALFQDCGLGKTFEQIEWAREVQRHTRGHVLILAPLAVAEQTVKEAARFGTKIILAQSDADCKEPGVYISNYEKLHKFTPKFSGIVLDESSCLKGDGPLRKSVTEFGASVPYRLACTATPSPNSYTELGNHAEFLGIMSMPEMLATFFVHDGGETAKWQLKGHAERAYWEWMASWSVCQRKPSDLGYSDIGFELPELIIHEVILDAGPAEGMLFAREARSLQERRAARRGSLDARVRAVADKLIENRLMLVVCERFGLAVTEPPEVKIADNRLLMTEKRDFMQVNEDLPKWGETEPPLDRRIVPWSWQKSEREFLVRFRSLMEAS